MTDKTSKLSQKKLFFLFFTALIFLILSGCAMNPGNGSGGGSSGNSGGHNGNAGIQNSFAALPNTYHYGLQYAASRLSDAAFAGEYNSWKNTYIAYPDASSARVKRDIATSYDTVSEGIGYGMLLAVYFHDQTLFDRLFNYMALHTNKSGLMHWRVRNDNINIDEFGFVVPYKDNLYTNAGATVTNTLAVLTATGYSPSQLGQFSVNGRGLTTASDADQDMALALCMAAKSWVLSKYINGKPYYFDLATNMIASIMHYDMHPGWLNTGPLFLGAGCYQNYDGYLGTWGGLYTGSGSVVAQNQAGWDPSYYMPAWYPVFKLLTGDAQWDQLNATMRTHSDYVSAADAGTGLFPDWCDTSSGACVRTTLCSEMGPQSFNFYYDAVRVPWRMAMAYSWFQDTKALTIADQIATFFNSKFYADNIYDGYTITGGPWAASLADPGSTANGGVDHSPVFYAMIAASTLPYGDSAYASDFCTKVISSWTDPGSTYHYFGNTLRLLSLLYLSGAFINLYDNNNYTAVPGQVNAVDYIFKNATNQLTNINNINYIMQNSSAEFLISNMASSPYALFSIAVNILADPKMPPGTYASPYYPYYYCYVDGECVPMNSSTIQLTPGLHTIKIECHSYVYLNSFNISYLQDSPITTIPATIDPNNYALLHPSASLSVRDPRLPGIPVVVSFGAPYTGTPYVEYIVNAPSAGQYTVSAPVYNNYFANNNISITSGNNLLGNMGPIPNSASVQTLSTTITLSAGNQRLRFSSAYDEMGPITISQGGGNL